MLFLYKFTNYLRSISNSQRRLIKIFFDFLIINLCIFLSTWLFNENLNNLPILMNINLFLYLLIGLPLFIFTGQYNEITSYIRSLSLYLIALRNFIFVFLFSLIANLFVDLNFDLKFSIILWISISTLQLLLRIVIRDIFLNFKKFKKNKIQNVAIYGAGSAGAQLNDSLGLSETHKVKFFIDDNIKISGMSIGGVKVISSSKINNHLKEIDKVFLAIPSLKAKRKREIVSFILEHNLPIMEVPSINEILTGTKNINSLKSIEINDLLYRDAANSSKELLNSSIKNSVVLITGAAGSIGSEISRQSLMLNPKKLIFIDHSEADLYKLNHEIKKMKIQNSIDWECVLGSVLNKSLIEELIAKNSVDIIFHCAAYKHVPILESNPLIGIHNNIFSTKIICECAIKSNVTKVILISTDKAVRPSNLMGATKRIAELLIQAFDDHEKSINYQDNLYIPTKFSSVRFGNVLESSGSVVPLFKSQIAEGGPITLTHPNIVRYFMTINEAAQLVLQTASLSEGGDLFLLDMGEAILIKDLAKKMISLSGLTLRDSSSPSGDIEIVLTGLRSGEKIREELLIDGKSTPTSHPLIYKAFEKFIKKDILLSRIDELEDNLIKNNKKEVFKIIKLLVPEWEISNHIKNNLEKIN